MSVCVCPAPAAIADITVTSCPNNLGQIRKLIFRRLDASTDFTTSSIVSLATWTTAMAASDDDHVVVSPLMANPIIAASEAITNGGNDNTTIGGHTEVNGSTKPQFTAQFLSQDPATIADIQALACETQNGTNLGVQFILGESSPGQIAGKLSTADVLFFPISSMFISSLDNQGFATRDRYNISFEFEDGCWQEALNKYTPTDFNALTDLA